MSNFRRMSRIAGTITIICLIWQFPKWWEVLSTDWQRGTGFVAGMAIGAYLLGCVVGLLVNLIILIFRKKS